MSDAASTWWTPAKERAFELVYEDRINDEDIARQLGICRKTLHNWKNHPAFRERLDEQLEEFKRRSIEDAVRRVTQQFR